jgi:hypothetical protein
LLIVPLQAVPNQTVAVTLASQSCQINVYEKTRYTGFTNLGVWNSYTIMFMDLYVNNVLIVGGVIARNGVQIVRDAYFGFTGDFMFVDTQGTSDPTSSELGSRYQLFYLEASDIVIASD